MTKKFVLVPISVIFLGGGGTVRAKPPLIETFIDNSAKPFASGEIRSDRDQITARFRISAGESRYRFMLEGLDDSWISPIEPMNFTVRFFDSKGDQIAQRFFPVTGDSPGWKGSMEKSLFSDRHETVTVPDHAERFAIVISSAGPPEAMGIYAVSDIGVLRLPAGNQDAIACLTNSKVAGTEPGWLWSKSGIHPTMASGTGLETPDSYPVLILKDDDITAHADWISRQELLGKIGPGDVLDITWKEMHSIGIGGARSEVYQRMPAGDYRFFAETLTLAGTPTGETASVRLVVPLPFWKNFLFWALVAGAVAAISYAWGRRIIRRKINRRIRHAQLISEERLRIARDLHDDLGTRLSHISLLGAHSESTVSDPATRAVFGEITSMCGELIAALSETVWLLNSKNNDLESLVNFLCRQLGELCKLSGMRCRIDAMSVGESRPVSYDFRHNYSLAVKETIHNALRHSAGTEIRMRIWSEGRALKTEVRDNGVGMPPDRRSGGTGIESVSQRMSSIGGRHTVEDAPEGGVRVLLEAPAL